MSWKKDNSTEPALEPELAEALGNFRQSVKAWSEAALRQPRTAEPRKVLTPVRQLSWRLVLTGAMACLLAVGTVGAIYVHHRGVEQAAGVRRAGPAARPLAPEQKAAMAVRGQAEEQDVDHAARELVAVQRLLAQEDSETRADAQVDEDLLAAVDTDVARQVPAAMEPLAQLADEGASQ